MFFLLSGEGPSDMGMCSSGADICELETHGGGFRPGPMALLVDFLATRRLGYSPKECLAMGFVSESAITRRKRRMSRRIMSLPRSEDKGALYHRVYAFIFGEIALEMTVEKGVPVIPVFFRDCDGSRSSPPDEWERKRRSVFVGFEQANCSAGVAMVPKPKSECWILCAVQKIPYRDCATLEELSGNDASPKRAPKKLLEEILDKSPDAAVLVELIECGAVDPERIDMPSFNAFKADFNRALHVAGAGRA